MKLYKFCKTFEKDWEKFGTSLEELWEKFGKIYLNLDGKMCYYRKILRFFKNFYKYKKMEEAENVC